MRMTNVRRGTATDRPIEELDTTKLPQISTIEVGNIWKYLEMTNYGQAMLP